MILKWKTPKGTWNWLDRVDLVTDQGWKSSHDAYELAQWIEGEEVSLVFDVDAPSDTPEVGLFRYVVLTIDGIREHHMLDAHDVYVLSDEGKTVDRLL